MNYALIMAGGIGSRFWPKSRIDAPKQFLSFFEDKTLLQNTIDRIRPIIPVERIIVSTNADYVDIVKEQIPDIPLENIVGEPVAKNTAPCIAFAASFIHYRDPEATMVVLPSDHFIQNEDAFLKDLELSARIAEEKNRLVTIGITPTRPETGYGYIQYNDENTISFNGDTAYPVKTFAEKPDVQTALKFLQSGDFLWNSGMFIWRTERVLEEIKKHLPVLHHQVEILHQHLSDNDGNISRDVLHSVYHSCFSVSIDYGIMEKSEDVVVVPSHFHWSDLGSWMAIYELQKDQGDEDGNILNSQNILTVKSQNCYVSSANRKLIALVGLQGIGLIETDDAMLICKLDSSQNVKEVYDKLEERDLREYR
ncbi:mannose-1-phosphate guanylyltransferase [Natronogracilivirga saccharolytica]|uniref:mannose-1-phosphate guanylyltransferase n=1 Tax=Natronogracilivirga saccharolytica TaxID=2812953 RepID=A0A8J7RGQ2_9BACT|nr:mannose-1-phosphate guanylyltransferase [Natronogracilivirga saccharolytica]MBP3191560.1 NTP transferase domain-containing protein [Natronogracilivirga saccharolytica]